MRLLSPRLTAADLAISLSGVVATVVVAYLAVSQGAQLSVGLLFGIATFIATVAAFATYPHIAVAATVAIFALVPMLKVFVTPEIGALKDLIAFGAIAAAALVFVFDRRPVDRWILGLVGLLLAMYVINVGAGHGVAWAQGLRLIGEPLLLLVVGLVLPDPRRTFRWAMTSLVVTASAVAFYGIVQQLVGKFTLVEWGYSFEAQVRSLSNGLLRSFGTLDDPFAYAALLLAGLAAVFFWLRRGAVAWGAGLLIFVGLTLSFTRTSVLILAAFAGLALARRGYLASAILIVAATLFTGAAVLVNASGSQSQVVAISSEGGATNSQGSANVILNGRISAWTIALGEDPGQWLLGRGVGVVGTAAARAEYTLTPASEAPDETRDEAVDSGYLATVADVGLAGLAVLLLLFGRLAILAAGATRRGTSAGWVALALLGAFLLDGLARSSFTGFPTAFLGLLLIGISIAAAQQESGSHTSVAALRR